MFILVTSVDDWFINSIGNLFFKIYLLKRSSSNKGMLGLRVIFSRLQSGTIVRFPKIEIFEPP